jgi:cell division transport system ATP-binding protein
MIRFEKVSKQYRGTSRPALDAVDLEINRGEFVFLVGQSGSGKSSCLRLMIKEDKPSSGSIHVLGQDLGNISSRKVPFFRRNLGVVFQDFRLLPNKTVFDNVAFTLQVIGKSRGFIKEAVPDVLQMVGLAGKANRYPHELSGGEQQRVAIARAIVNKPALLLADEPTGNLDPATSAGIMALLERINAGGTTIVMATHAADFVDRMQRRVIELQQGVIVRDEKDAGYGETAAMPIAGADTTIKDTGDLSAIRESLAQRPPEVSGDTGTIEPLTTLDAVPSMPDTFQDQSIDDTGELATLPDDFLQPSIPAPNPAEQPITARFNIIPQERTDENEDDQEVGPVQ